MINELYRHIGADVDVPAGDIGVGAREMGFMYGQYKRLTGNVAIYATEKAQQLGAKVVTVSDSNGYVYDENGIDLQTVQQIRLPSR